MQLTLVVPELVWPEPDDHDSLDGLPCPGLGTLIARSQLSSRPPQSMEATLCDAFGVAENAAYGAFRVLGESCCDVTNTSYAVGLSSGGHARSGAGGCIPITQDCQLPALLDRRHRFVWSLAQQL